MEEDFILALKYYVRNYFETKYSEGIDYGFEKDMLFSCIILR